MTNHTALKGHFIALFTILVWGTTFISTKVLLTTFSPIEILFIRFVLGFITLLIFYPKLLAFTTWKREALFAFCGFTGVTLYYLLENIALTYTQAANVGVIVSISPFFIVILSHFLTKKSSLSRHFFIGFVLAIIGIMLISFGSATVNLNPVGNLLAVIAAIIWAAYTIGVNKINTFGYHIIQVTQRIFFYGLLLMIPIFVFSGSSVHLKDFNSPVILANFAFLSFVACAVCFISWNYATKLIGPVKTSLYIYLIPVVTALTAMFVLHEVITAQMTIGIVLTLLGLFFSENRKLGLLKNNKKTTR